MGKDNRILIVDDHTLLREGLRNLISSEANLQVVGDAENGMDAIRRLDAINPDLVLMDLSMPKMNGFEAIAEIKRRRPHIKIIALTVHTEEEYILTTLEAGADGYVLKDASRTEFLLAIRTVLEGKRYLSPGVSERVIEGYLEGRKTLKTQTPWDTVTPREREILKLIAEGYKNKEIADCLFISLKTVEKHRANLMKKLDLRNSAALTLYAMEKGLVSR